MSRGDSGSVARVSSGNRACAWVWLVVLGLCAGCSGAERRVGFDSMDPSERTAAAARAAQEGDLSAVPDLILMLDSSDPAARMVAAASLERLTGERLGYDATAERAERSAAVDRWVRYAIEHGLAEDNRGGTGGGTGIGSLSASVEGGR